MSKLESRRTREAERLAILRRTSLLDSPPEPSFDRVTCLASRLVGAQIALVSLVAEDRQFFKSCHGLPEPWASRRETPLSHSFCKYVVEGHAPLIVMDARADSRVCENPAVRDLGVIAYLGVPLTTPDGSVLGALCAIEPRPRQWSVDDLNTMNELAAFATAEIELRLQAASRQETEGKLRRSQADFRALADAMPQIVYLVAPDGRLTYLNQRWKEYTGVEVARGVEEGKGWGEAIVPEDFAIAVPRWWHCMQSGETFETEFRLRRADGLYRWHLSRAMPERDDTGTIVCWFGCCTDIDDRKRAQERHATEAAALAALAGSAGPIETIRDVLGGVASTLGFDVGEFWEIEPRAEVLRLSTHWARTPQIEATYIAAARTLSFEIGEGLPGRIWSNGRPDWIESVHDDRTFHRRDEAAAAGLRGAVGFPVVCESGTLGVLTFFMPESQPVDARLVESLARLGSQIGLFLERRRAQDALDKATALRNAIVDGANYSIIATDEKGTILTFNAAAESWLGHRADEVVGQANLALVHDERELRSRAEQLSIELGERIDPGFEVLVARARRGGCEEREWTYVAKDGIRFPVRLSVTALRDASGRINGFMGIAGDLSEQKRADAARARFTAILEETTDLVYIADVSGRILHLNRAARLLAGIGEGRDVSHLRITDLHPEWAARQIVLAGIPAAIRDGAWSGETAVVESDREIPVSHVILAHGSTQGRVDYVSSVMRNISEHKQLAESLKRARDAAETAGRAKSDFLANMSHEIRTPMNGIIGMTEILLNTRLDHAQRGYASTIRNSADALLTVINDILDLSKIEAGKLAVELVELDLRTLMEEVAELLAPRAHKKGLQILCWIPPELPRCLVGDPVRIRQILTNLAGNAVKFTESGEVILSAAILENDRDGDGDTISLRLSVQDSGIGIPCEKHEAIFETFTQAEGSTNRRYGGTGLGLTICRRLAQLMGGRIALESQPGVGSTFWLDVALRVVGRPSEGGADGRAEFSGVRVLVADESRRTREILRGYLSAWGCLVEEVGTAREAKSLLRSRASRNFFQVVLLDDQIVRALDGILDRSLDKASSTPPTRLILLRSTQTRQNQPEAGSSHLAAALVKPVRSSDLFRTIAEVTARGTARGSPSAQTAPTSDARVQLGLSVLVVEDQEVNRDVAARMLEQLDCRVEFAVDGRQAVNALNDRGLDFDLVLMDVQMPSMDGLEATGEIRRLEREHHRRRMPIIAMTSHALEGDRERCLQAGMDDYLAKPVRRNDLVQTLGRWAVDRASSREHATMPVRPASAARSRTFDLQSLTEMCGGDRGFVHELATKFLEMAISCLEKIRSAQETDDAPGLAEAAHALRGICLTVGAGPISEHLQRIESLGLCGETSAEAAQPLIDQVLQEWERLRIELDEVVAV